MGSTARFQCPGRSGKARGPYLARDVPACVSQTLQAATSAPQNTVLPLSALDGSIGFKLDGEVAGDSSGLSVGAAGDINGDGIDDLIIGAYHADSNGDDSGRSYVVFGRDVIFANGFDAD